MSKPNDRAHHILVEISAHPDVERSQVLLALVKGFHLARSEMSQHNLLTHGKIEILQYRLAQKK